MIVSIVAAALPERIRLGGDEVEYLGTHSGIHNT
jgi:hypothetical protein